ncbi:MAG: dTDP-4-dehydrorhamnose reductase [Thermodesulfobacteriota bacterium]
MDVLVTGAKGQLGRDLVGRLEAAGLVVAARGSSELDVTDRGRVSGAVKEAAPQVVINCAAYTAVDRAEAERDRAFEVNAAGARNLALAARESRAALIHISTDFVFDGARPEPYTELDPPRPLGVYGASKLAGEREIERALDEHVIVRASWLYGSAGGGNFVKTILGLAAERERLRVVYDQTGSPTWTGDLADALVAVTMRIGRGGGRAPYGTYHYSNEGVASWYDLAVAAIEGARGLGAELRCASVEPIRTSEYPTPAARPAYSVLDKGKIKETFGVAIPHWRASLGKMLAELYPEKIQ